MKKGKKQSKNKYQIARENWEEIMPQVHYGKVGGKFPPFVYEDGDEDEENDEKPADPYVIEVLGVDPDELFLNEEG